MYDPHVDSHEIDLTASGVFFIGTKHSEFAEYEFAKGSVVIDPWRFMPDQEGVKTLRIGSR